jgi:archaeosine synthase
LLAPGVVDADEQIRPGDEVIIVGEKAFGVGRARMSGWEMRESQRGVAVEIRHIKEK